MCLDCEHDIFKRGEFTKNLADLIRAAKPRERARRDRQIRQVAPLEHDGTGVRAQLSYDLRNESRLAGTIRPDDCVQFTGENFEIDVIGGCQAAESLDQTANRQHRVHERQCSTMKPYRPRFAYSTTRITNTPITSCQCWLTTCSSGG